MNKILLSKPCPPKTGGVVLIRGTETNRSGSAESFRGLVLIRAPNATGFSHGIVSLLLYYHNNDILIVAGSESRLIKKSVSLLVLSSSSREKKKVDF